MKIIILRGVSCSGKTALEHMVTSGETHLVNVPQLKDEAGAFHRYVTLVELTQALEAGDLRAVAEGEGDTFIVDTCIHAEKVVEAFPDAEITQVALVTSWPLLLARRRLRYILAGVRAGVVQNWPRSIRQATGFSGPNYVEQMTLPGVPTTWVDTSDYPWEVIPSERVRATLSPSYVQPDLGDPKELYQQALHIGGEWRGNDARIEFERGRQDVVLPEVCDGMAVMDIGCSEGGFLYEVLNRGAAYTLGVEIRDPQLDLMKRVRNGTYLPLSTANVNIDKHPLPSLTGAGGAEAQWDLILLLNILHRVVDPAAVLKGALSKSKQVVVEAPFYMGLSPCKPEGSHHPGTWHLPPAWVKGVAEANGFEVVSIAVGPHAQDQRLVYKLRRRA